MRGLTPRRRPGADEDVSSVVVPLIDGSPLNKRERASLLRRLAVVLGGSARRAGTAAVASGRWLTDTVEELAPHVPVRDYRTLRDHYEGLSGNELARAMVDTAARATGAVGAAGGLVSTIEFSAAPPLLLTTPVQIAAETLAVVAIELKLVAELHEVYGRTVVGTPAVRAAAYLGSWTRQRRIESFGGAGGLGSVVSSAARRQLRRRILRRAGSNVTTMMPFMAGAVAGASLNARETRRLGEALVKDLGGKL